MQRFGQDPGKIFLCSQERYPLTFVPHLSGQYRLPLKNYAAVIAAHQNVSSWLVVKYHQMLLNRMQQKPHLFCNYYIPLLLSLQALFGLNEMCVSPNNAIIEKTLLCSSALYK